MGEVTYKFDGVASKETLAALDKHPLHPNNRAEPSRKFAIKVERPTDESYADGTMRLFEDVAGGKVTPKDAVDRLMVIDAVRAGLNRGPFDGERLFFGGLYVLGACFFASAVALTIGLVRWAVGL